MQISVLGGAYAAQNAEIRASIPVNLMPVPKVTGISGGYLRPAEGLKYLTELPGKNRGGINWRGIQYRVHGSKVSSVSPVTGATQPAIDIANGTGRARLDYSTDTLAIATGGALYYHGAYNGQVTDSDLGNVKDMVFIDGYFMTTDGKFLVVTELNDPTSVLPTKYGSSERDPDPIMAIRRVRSEVYAINQYTCEVFQNVGGSGFPFARIDGAHLTRGAVGTHAVAVMDNEALVFVGSGRNEPMAVWFGANGSTLKLSTREIDLRLAKYTVAELTDNCVVETRIFLGHRLVYVHLPDYTLVYDFEASRAFEEPIWYQLSSSSDYTDKKYRARDFVYVANKWYCADPDSGIISEATFENSDLWGVHTTWSFETLMLYNEGRGGIIHELELATVGGQVLFDGAILSTKYSLDGGSNWSPPQALRLNKSAPKRLRWLRQGLWKNTRIQRFFGTSATHLSFSRLDARVEALNV